MNKADTQTIPSEPSRSIRSCGLGHTLSSGHSVVVQSHETISLPPDIGAIALPPSRISSKGIFIANFGHVDPGYGGRMRFTIINMGKSDYTFSRGDDIITMLFFKIEPAIASWETRNPNPRVITQSEVDVLAKDFADFDNRITKLTKKAIGESGYQYVLARYVLPSLVAAAIAYLTFIASVYLQFQTRIETLSATTNKLENFTAALQDKQVRLDKAQDSLESVRAKEREDFSKRLLSLEDSANRNSASELDAILKRFDTLESRLNSLPTNNPGK